MGLLSLFASQLGGASAPSGPVPVVWDTLVAMTTTGGDNSALDSTSTGWGTSIAGATGQAIVGGAAGYVEFIVLDSASNKGQVFGLSDRTTGNSYTSLRYGVQTTDPGAFGVYENGANVFNGGSYVAGDVVRIETTGTSVLYKKNGATFYTSALSPSATTVYPVCAALRPGLQFTSASVLV